MRVRVLVEKWVIVKKSAVERLQKCQRERLCLACMQPLKEGEKPIRGCHSKCARATYRAISSGAFTDAQRVSEGKWLDRDRPGPKPTNPVTEEARLSAG